MLSYSYFDCDEIICGIRLMKKTNKKIMKKILDPAVGWEIINLCHNFETLKFFIKMSVLVFTNLNGSCYSTQNSLRKTVFRLKIHYFLNFLEQVL